MAGRIGSLILKDTIQFARDKTILAVVFWMYTIEVLICGYGMTFEVRDLPVAVVDNDRSPLSRDLIDRFELSEAFEIVGYPADPATAEQWMRRGKAQYGLVIPVNFGRDLEHGRAPQLQVLLDGTNSTRLRWPRTTRPRSSTASSASAPPPSPAARSCARRSRSGTTVPRPWNPSWCCR